VGNGEEEFEIPAGGLTDGGGRGGLAGEILAGGET